MKVLWYCTIVWSTVYFLVKIHLLLLLKRTNVCETVAAFAVCLWTFASIFYFWPFLLCSFHFQFVDCKSWLSAPFLSINRPMPQMSFWFVNINYINKQYIYYTKHVFHFCYWVILTVVLMQLQIKTMKMKIENQHQWATYTRNSGHFHML